MESADLSTCGDEGFHQLHYGEVDLAQSGGQTA
jgi:hypothetical protein